MIPQRILVTGGAGFIGSHTVDLLLQQDREVVVLDNLFSGKLKNLDLKHPNLEFVEGDVLEYPLIEDLLTHCDAVLHLAAIASVPQSIENPIYTFQVNTQGFLHVLEAVRSSGRPIRLVYASSAAVYGEAQSLPCRDDAPLSGMLLSPYALQKKQDEDYADLYERLHGVKSLALRYFNVYGERQDPHSPYSGVISRFLDAYQNSAELTIFGDGRQSRDFIHVSDVARANWLALQGSHAGAINIATGHPETLLNLIQCLEEAGGRPAKLRFEPARAGDIPSSYASVTEAEMHIGFTATLPLKEGISRLVKQTIP
ncbi:NAD-dependent epimerase/dehydratase family protein [Aquicella lusitana]|uniref:UDP-glucose 4-epimerase n=1 Tax=Aquicella lusitana TaxID=254246 RepID=A0A370GMS6_9COXI|nr:NAD-dependent epimerase/dehydratase family protein [Aquicella lusitana]RDI44599.1 UDP-glucose 4-epimerase [Aquicella lusitana]VVC72459.1 UDP-N-acetylglucosamine 4-epimerase [Aquicella lusitana]